MTEDTFNFSVVIGKARELETRIKLLEDEHKARMEPYNSMKAKLRNILLERLISAGMQNTATPSGGCHQIKRVTVSLDDPDEFLRHVIGTQQFELLDRKANKTACEDFLKEHGALPPGVKRSEMLDIGLTAPAKPTVRRPRTNVVAPESNNERNIESLI